MLKVDGMQTKTLSCGIARGDQTLICCQRLQAKSTGLDIRLRFPMQFAGSGQCNCSSEPLAFIYLQIYPLAMGKCCQGLVQKIMRKDGTEVLTNNKCKAHT